MSMKELMAAGNSLSSDAPNVEDVFSTYLYEGTGATQSIENGINLGDFGVGTSTDFDDDYLSRSSDLTGNADGKTVTFSCWVYFTGEEINIYSTGSPGTNGMFVDINTSGYFNLGFYGNPSNMLQGRTNVSVAKNAWSHCLFTADISNTSYRHVYINDVDVTSGVTWHSYTNATNDVTVSSHRIGGYVSGGGLAKFRLAHFFLDYTYRDLSTTSNRRLFIDANGGSTSPATLSALNPIMYLPMTDGYTIGENIGTGGDFTSNGSPTIINRGTEYVADSGEGGMVWIKNRDRSYSNYLFDTERDSLTNALRSDSTSGEVGAGSMITSANSDGFTLDSNWSTNIPAAQGSASYASWTFRKAPRFFDCVTFTGDGTSGHEIAHNLGCEVGMMVVKKTNGTNHWTTYHRSADATAPEDKYLRLNTTEAVQDYVGMWNDTAPTSSAFTVGNDETNNNGGEYVAYLFAHDPDGANDDGMIACGSFTTNSSYTPQDIDLGWEPQWFMYKRTDSSGNWFITDTMRSWTTFNTNGTTGETYLYANLATAEGSPNTWGSVPTATGVNWRVGGLTSNSTYIYMAIRAPMMKEPESGSEVFAIDTRGSTGDGNLPAYRSPFAVDAAIKRTTNLDNTRMATRLLGSSFLKINTTDAEVSSGDIIFDFNNGHFNNGSSSSVDYSWMFKRAKGFFDVVAYTGDATAGRTINHSLGVVPEMIWFKKRSAARNWTIVHADAVRSNGDTGYDVSLNFSVGAGLGGVLNSTAPTDSLITVSGSHDVNGSSATYIAYLFATLEGVSKCGGYTGNGSSQNIACGFSNGTRFVLIKRTDLETTNSDFYIWDTERGIVSGNDPHLSLNTTVAEVTSDDSIDPQSAGFTVNQVSATNINVSSGEYIFLAIA